MLTLVHVSWDQITGAPVGDKLGGASMFVDLENARESLCQDSPLWKDGGPICISEGTSVCLWFPFLPGVHRDLPGHPAQTLQVRVQVHCSLEQVQGEKSSHSLGTTPPAVQGLPCAFLCSDLAALWVLPGDPSVPRPLERHRGHLPWAES